MVKYKWSLFIGALLFISCSDNEGTPASRKWPVCFSSDLSERVVSRAANDSWDTGDQVGVYMVPHVADASAAADFSVHTGAVNVPYVTSGSGKSVSLSVVSGHNAIIYPKDGSRVNFVAYYPYKSDTHTANANVYKVNVSNQSPSKAIDLIYHKGVGTPYDHSTKDTDVALAFTHQLSKVKINLVPDSGVGVDLSGATVTLSGFPTTADFNLSTGVLTNLGGTIPSLTPVKDGSASSANQAVFEAIVVPHSGTSYARTVTFTIGGQAYSYILSVLDGFKQGTAYDYTFKFTGKDVISMGCTIHNWGYDSSNYLLTTTQTEFNLTAHGDVISDEALRVDFLTTTPGQPTCTTSLQSDTETSVKPDWIKPVLSAGAAFNGWTSYTLTFSATDNLYTFRTGYILVRMSNLIFAVTVSQAGEALFLDRVDSTGEDIILPFTDGSGSFAVATNSWQAPVIKYSTDGVLANATDNVPGSANWFIKGGTSSSAYTGGGKIGTQYTTTYSYTENMGTNERIIYIHVIDRDDAMNAALRFKVTQKALSPHPATSVADGMANCYMIQPDESFAFPVARAYRYENGAFTDELRIGGTHTGGFDVAILWTDVNDLVRISKIAYVGKNAKVYIRAAAGKTGNALIGLYKSGGSDILWSWHIWVTDYAADNTWTNNGYTFMDRNLGATDNGINSVAQVRASHGLLYQWGRKDPMPNGLDGAAGYSAINKFYGIPFQGAKDNSKFSLENQSLDEAIISSVKHPTTYYDTYKDMDWLPVETSLLWTDEKGNKTIYDPCPAGWRAPGRIPSPTGLIAVDDIPWNNSNNWTRTVYDGRAVAWAPNDVNNNSMLIETPTIYGWNGVDFTRGRYWLGYGSKDNRRVGNAWSMMEWALREREKNEANPVRCAKENTP
jgi:hypothetical protein